MSKVSIVVPVYNVEQYLEPCFESIRCQSYEDFEVVIVDDGSCTECKKNLPDTKKYPFCTVLTHRRNRGKGASLKTAFLVRCKNWF